ncbi:MAG: MFS transporter [Bernardetiaceae bacterium]
MEFALNKERLYTPLFVRLCLSAFFFTLSFNIIIPELPNYLSSLGGQDYKGLIISLFALTAGLSRPFSGKLTDTMGRVPVMIFGVVICTICGVLYPILGSVIAFLVLRFFHGLSTGFTPTGLSAYLADITPTNRRGEGMGILGLSNSMGIAGGPVLGQELLRFWPSLDVLFYTSSLLAVVSLLILWGLPETLTDEHPRSAKAPLRLRWVDVFEPRVWPAALVMLLSTVAFGIVLTIIPDFSEHLGLRNKGLFFGFLVIGSASVRILGGRIFDRFSRSGILFFSTAGLIVASLYTVFVESQTELFISGLLFGIAVGFNSPTLFAWGVDLSLAQFRGRAMATLYIALEAGVAMGALLSGWLYANDAANFGKIFLANALCALLACVVAGRWWWVHHRI